MILEIFNTDSYLMMQAIEKSKLTKFLSYYALSKVHSHKHKSYFRIILLLSGDINLNPAPSAVVLPLSNDEFQIFSSSEDGNLNFEKWAVLKRKVYISFASILTSTKNRWTAIFNQIVKGFYRWYWWNQTWRLYFVWWDWNWRVDLLRLDRSRRGGGFACYIKRSLAYNYKDNFAKALRVSLLIFSYQKRNQY